MAGRNILRFMKKICGSGWLVLVLSANLYAQQGPFDPEMLPGTLRASGKVHFVSIDGAFQAANTNWLPCLRILTGGDQVTEPVTVGGHTGVQVGGIKFNAADESYPVWANQ